MRKLRHLRARSLAGAALALLFASDLGAEEMRGTNLRIRSSSLNAGGAVRMRTDGNLLLDASVGQGLPVGLSRTRVGEIVSAGFWQADGGPIDLALCVGDCDGDDQVDVSELVRGVNIALGTADAGACPSSDRDADGSVSVAELVTAVGNALNGCNAPGL